ISASRIEPGLGCIRHARRRPSPATVHFTLCWKTACRHCGKWPGCWCAKANRARPAVSPPPAHPEDSESAILAGYSDANVAELVDAPGLGPGGATRASSSLAFRTKALVAVAAQHRTQL